MQVYRTPEKRFAALPDFSFAPRHVTLPGGLRVDDVDEAPRDGPLVFLLHGSHFIQEDDPQGFAAAVTEVAQTRRT